MSQKKGKNPPAKREKGGIPTSKRKKLPKQFWRDAEKLKKSAIGALQYIDWLKRNYK